MCLKIELNHTVASGKLTTFCNVSQGGFGGLRVSVLAEAVGFLRAEKSSARLPSEGK
jgi:hypothetical protein